MDHSSEEYKKFITQLHALPRPSDPKPRSTLEIYTHLQYDFPLVTEAELKAFVEEVAGKQIDVLLHAYPLTKPLMKAIHHGVDSKVEATIRLQYSRVAAILLVKLFHFITKTSDSAKVDLIFNKYEVDPNEQSIPVLNHTNEASVPPEKEADHHAAPEEKVTNEDPDDFVFEPLDDHAAPPLFDDRAASHPTDATAVASTAQRIDDLVSYVTYSLFECGTVWDDHRLTEEFCGVLSNTSSRYWRSFAPLVLVLRDRVAAVPASLPAVLPTVVAVLKTTVDIVPGEPNHRVFLSLISGSLQHKQQHKSAPSKALLQTIASAVLPEIPYIASSVLKIFDNTTQQSLPLDLIADLTSLVNATSLVVEHLGAVAADAVMRTGLLRDLLRTFIKFTPQSRDMESFEQALLRLCFHSQKLAAFLAQVPEFVSVVKSPFFVAQYLPDRVVWLLVFSLQQELPDARAFYAESCANLKVLVELRSDLPLVPQLKLLQRVTTNISLLASSSTPLFSHPMIMKQPFLRDLLTQLQYKMKQLQKRPQEGASIKKENKLVAQIIDMLKHLLGESGKKD